MAFVMSARGSPGPGRFPTVAIAAAKVGSAPDSVRHRRAPNVGGGEGEGGVRALWLVRGRKPWLARINKGGAAALSRAGRARESAAAEPAPQAVQARARSPADGMIGDAVRCSSKVAGPDLVPCAGGGPGPTRVPWMLANVRPARCRRQSWASGGDGVSMANELRTRGPRAMAACPGSAERGGGRLHVFVTNRYLDLSMIH